MAGLALVGRMAGSLLDLPPCRCKVQVTRIVFQTRDGVNLVSSMFSALKMDENGDIVPSQSPSEPVSFPTIIVRTPYNRKHLDFVSRRFAERGYHVLVQDTRGRCESEGDQDPLLFDEQDGQDTIAWLHTKEWFKACPRVAMWGMSFLGMVQFAALSPRSSGNLHLNPTCLCTIMCSSRLHPIMNPDGNLALSLFTRWHYITHHLGENTTLLDLMQLMRKMDKRTKPAFRAGLRDIDRIITGQDVETVLGRTLRENIDAPADGPFYQKRDYTSKLECCPPSLFIGGWYDFFLREVLQDYAAVRGAEAARTAAGCVRGPRCPGPACAGTCAPGEGGSASPAPRPTGAGARSLLIVGPWHHFDKGAAICGFKEGLWWFDSVLQNTPAPRPPPPPVRLYVMGANVWRSYDEYPPPAMQHQLLFLAPNRTLAAGAPTGSDCTPDTYTMDPADPTPNVGGGDFHPTDAGAMSQNRLEARSDVVTFTSPRLRADLEIVGPVRAVLYVRSSAPHTDFVVRLCVVGSQAGGSTNLCDGCVRVQPGTGDVQSDGTLRLTVDMWATAFRFKPGQRVRVQVCSAAFPRYMVNPGTGERFPEMEAGRITGLPQHQEIFHDESHPSAIHLPVTQGTSLSVAFPPASAASSCAGCCGPASEELQPSTYARMP